MKGYCGNPLRFENSGDQLSVHQDLGKKSVGDGKYSINPWIGWSAPSKSYWDWRSYVSRFGFMAQGCVGGWDMVIIEQATCSPNEDKDGPGELACSHNQSWKRNENEITLNQTFKTIPDAGIDVTTQPGYMRRDKNWSLWLRHKWNNLEVVGEDSEFSAGVTFKPNEKVTLAMSALLQLDPEYGEELDGNIHMGATWKPCPTFKLTGKLSGTRDDGDNELALGFNLRNKWLHHISSNLVLDFMLNNPKNAKWGLSFTNNL